MIDYDMPLYRPPSEGYNVIIQVTLGCSFNKCAFCSMYESKTYHEKTLTQIYEDIDQMAAYYSHATKVFLADGDAMNLPTSQLLLILEYLYKKFENLRRVSCYASPFNLLDKSLEELKSLKNAGLQLIYYGIESGNYELLKMIQKPMKPSKMVEGLNKASQAGLKISATVILGLGGKAHSKAHIKDTAQLVNECEHLNFLSTLQLGLADSKEPNYFKRYQDRFGEFEWCSDREMLQEQYDFLSLIKPKKPIIFRSNHASNALPLKGNLPKDTNRLLEELLVGISHEEILRPKFTRRL